MHQVDLRFTSAVVWTLTLMMVITSAHYTPPKAIGLPAGLIPECPGIMKNASISPKSLRKLIIGLHRIDATGQLRVTDMPMATAHKTLAKMKLGWRGRRVVVHAVGWWDSALWPHSRALATAYARRGYIVLVTDTFTFFTTIYPKSVRLTRTIGQKLGELLVQLVSLGMEPSKLELVGISLGAHVASFAARHLAVTTGNRARRLTGLDPAGPCFRALPREFRFNSDYADQVDALHTNIDGFGLAEAVGHIDIYANGGEWQPSDIPYVPCLVICSHLRAIFYWWQAIEHPKKFVALQCDSVQDARTANCYNSTVTNYLGVEAQFDRPGIYYLSTGNEFPYYKGAAGLRADNEVYTSVVRSINDDDGFEI